MPTQKRQMTTGKNMLAIGACGVVACVAVSLISLMVMGVLAAVFGLQDDLPFFSDNSLSSQIEEGVQLALLLGMMNFVLFFITIPAAWLALGFTLGRKPRKGIVKPISYYRDAMIGGALLVGLTTGIFASLDNSWISGLSSALVGSSVGAAAGAVCALIYLLIVKPAKLYTEPDAKVFE